MSVIEKLINNPSEMLDDLLSKYFNNINVEDKTKISEFEIRFGRLNTISKYDFDSVISKLVDKGFKTDNIYGDDLLRISFEDQDELKDLRLEFEGNDIIEKICNNEMDTLEKEFSKVNLSPNISVIKKNFNKDNKFENKDYGFVVSYQFEEIVGKSIVNENMKNYLKMKKYYRCLNRTEYTHKNYPFKIHMSLVKSSEYKNNSYRLYNSGLLQCPIKYEIEIEIDNKMIKNVSLDSLKTNLRYIIKNILCGIQNSNYPISYSKITNVKKEYLNLIGLDKNVNDIAPLDFIGYSTSILEMKHIQQDESYSDINIHSDYTVTDKADGERKLLLINSKGELNLLNSRLDVQYTGIKTNKKEYYNTIIDGEHIWNNEINMYAAFDIYYLNGNEENKEKTKGPIFKNPFWNETIGRYCLLSNLINDVEKNIDQVVSFTLKCKHFEIIKNYKDIFEKSKIILNSPKPYLTDGLIFTPASKCVGWMPDTEIKTLNKRYRWVYSLKWKPPEQNTVDFLVSVKDTIRYSGSKQYKRMDLYCGFKGFENPFEELLNFNKNSDIRSLNYKKNVYRKVLFKPSNPIFDEAYICNLFLKYHQNGKYELLTQENEIIEDDTIVEFSYDIDNKDNIDDVTFLWKPLRIRYDKTEEYRKQKTNFGNDYAVANSNWYYINNPITKDMISTGKDIPSIDNNDIYYNKSITISGSLNNLNKFHNDVKRKLINEFTIPGIDNYLMDFAVGKGGDLPKWIESKLKFVFGVDIFKDNIENKFDGACVRYFNYIINNYRSKYKKNIPDILFATADSSKLIKNGDATKYDHNGNPLSKNINTNIIDSVFGTKINDNYQSLKLYHGVGEKGFNITSCQFAIHYFFKNKETLSNFISNIIQCTRDNGYFICTSYDGSKIFNLLKDKPLNYEETRYVKDTDVPIWKVIKKYDNETFNNNITSLGYTIGVYQESINQTIDEYLVNYNYFIQVMEHFGFKHIKDTDLNTFESIYGDYSAKLINDKKDKLLMSENEKFISFLNVCYIFQKKPTYGNDVKIPINLDSFVPIVDEKLKVYDENDVYNMEQEKLNKEDSEEKEEEEEEGEEDEENEKETNVNELEETNNYLSYEFIDSIPSIVDNMYDDNIVFCFNSRSNSKPFPGEGVGEIIPDHVKNDYKELHKIKDWRKMLSNNWTEPFKYDEKTWNSAEHYYQASKFKKDNPEFYNLFSLESESDISKSAEMAKAAGSKTGKLKGQMLRDKNIKIDKDFYNTERHDREMYVAQYYKFMNPNAGYLRDMLLKTRDSKLMHILMKNPIKEFFVNLVVFRNLMLNNKI